MAILWLFENCNVLTFKDLSDNTKLTDEQLIKHLQSLVDARLLLASHPSLPAIGNFPEELINSAKLRRDVICSRVLFKCQLAVFGSELA